jgi:hypothetical protein
VSNFQCIEDWGCIEEADLLDYDIQTINTCGKKVCKNLTIWEREFDYESKSSSMSLFPLMELDCSKDYSEIADFCKNYDSICKESTEKCGKEIDGINECNCPISNEVRQVRIYRLNDIKKWIFGFLTLSHPLYPLKVLPLDRLLVVSRSSRFWV